MARLCASILLLCALCGSAQGAPLYGSRIGGLALVGPATRHPGSLFYNPATMGFLHGHHLYIDGMAALSATSVELRQTDPASGAPTGGSAPAERSLTVMPQLYGAAISDLGLDSLVVGVAVHTPTWERTSYGGVSDDFFDGAAQGASRYHGVSFSLFQLYVTLGAALRITEGWYIGFSTSYVFGSLSYSFVRDAALLGGASRDTGEYIALDDCGGGQRCGYGNDRAAEAIRISGTSNALGFAAGLIGRVHPKVVIGVGYVSALVGLGGSKIPADGDAWVRRSEAVLEAAQAELGSVKRDLRGRSLVNYQLPDIVSAGVTWRIRPKLTLSGQLRWMTYRRHDRLDIRLSGRELQRDPQVPQQLVHYRGFHDVVAVQLGARWRVSSRLELAGGLMVESSAVSSSALSPIAAEGWKIDAVVATRLWLTSRLSLRAGLGLIWVPTIDNDDSDFDPSTLPACVDARFDVDNASCKQAAAGRGMASTAGSYGALSARLGLGLSYDWR